MTKLSLKYGNSKISCIAFAVFSVILGVKLGETKNAAKLSEISLDLFKLFSNKRTHAKFYMPYLTLTKHIKDPIRNYIDDYISAYRIGVETGEVEWGALCLFKHNYLLFHCGKNLNEIWPIIKKNCESGKELQQSLTLELMTIPVQVVENLLFSKEDVHVLEGEFYNEIQIQNQDKEPDELSLFFYTTFKLNLLYRFGRYNETFTVAKKMAKYYEAGFGLIEVIYWKFYEALAALTLCLDKELSKRMSTKIAKKAIKLIKNWSLVYDGNFRHFQLILEAKLALINHKHQLAISLYVEAIKSAEKYKFTQDVALGYEELTQLYISVQEDNLAKKSVNNAIAAYEIWGSKANSIYLKRHYKDLIGFDVIDNDLDKPKANVGHAIDISTVIKASQTLSGEIKLERLLEKMLRILIENAGAEYGVLVENRDKKLFVQAKWSTDEDLQINLNEALEVSTKLPLSIVYYVQRSHEIIVLDDAMSSNFSTDTYISGKLPKSILCFPIINKGELKGVVYLENNLTTGAFTEDRLEVLNMLSSQLAISLENAFLYENLEAKVEERTVEVEAQKLKLEKQAETLQEANKEISLKNEHITSSIAYAKTIQQAVLPDIQQIKQYVQDAFILYKPKDVVSGDFFWFTHVNGDSSPKTIVAAVDCTGHGVPGAFMSMIGNTLLNEIVNQKRITNTEEILEELNRRVRESLKQSEKKNNDGMDMCLCCIEQKGDEFLLSFTGAKRPLYIFNHQTNQLVEINGDRKSIGGIKENDKQFTRQEVMLAKGTNVYLTTDGFVDQNNMERRKFGTKLLREVLTQVSGQSGEEQLRILQRSLKQHQRGAQQRDDITMIGLKL